jgi:hypothetical protein
MATLELRDHKVPKAHRANREIKAQPVVDPLDPQAQQGHKEPRDHKEPKEPKVIQEFKEPKVLVSKAQQDHKEPKEPKAM